MTLDEDVLERVKDESRARGLSFRDTLNQLLRIALLGREGRDPVRTLAIEPIHMGYRANLNHDDIESLIEYGEGERHR